MCFLAYHLLALIHLWCLWDQLLVPCHDLKKYRLRFIDPSFPGVLLKAGWNEFPDLFFFFNFRFNSFHCLRQKGRHHVCFIKWKSIFHTFQMSSKPCKEAFYFLFQLWNINSQFITYLIGGWSCKLRFIWWKCLNMLFIVKAWCEL